MAEKPMDLHWIQMMHWIQFKQIHGSSSFSISMDCIIDIDTISAISPKPDSKSEWCNTINTCYGCTVAAILQWTHTQNWEITYLIIILLLFKYVTLFDDPNTFKSWLSLCSSFYSDCQTQNFFDPASLSHYVIQNPIIEVLLHSPSTTSFYKSKQKLNSNCCCQK